MKLITKKLWVFVAMLCTLISASAYDFEVDGIYYGINSISDKYVYVTYKTNEYNSYSGVVNIPTTVSNNGETYTVTDIGPHAFRNSINLISVTIPNSVTEISNKAFYNCSKLSSLTVGSSLEYIGYQAFTGTDKISKVIWLGNTPPSYYPDPYGIKLDGKINYVSNEEFSLSNQKVYPFLSSRFEVGNVIYVPVSPSERTCEVIDCNYSPSSSEIVIDSIVNNRNIQLKVLNVNSYSFYGNSKIKNIKLKFSGTIGDYAFANNTSLQEIIIPDNITSLGVETFSGCSSLTNVTIGKGINSLPYGLFSRCESLASIVIPNNINSIDNSVFFECSNLGDVTIEEGESTLSLGFSYFYERYPLFVSCKLDEVFIGRKLSYNTASDYGYSPFYRNTSLRSVTITNAETQIYANEFYGCSNLQEFACGNGITTIGQRAFSGCSALKTYSSGSKVESIGAEAFSDCTALTSFTSYAAVPPTCGTQALDDINKWECTLHVPAESIDDYQAADQWKDFFYIDEASGIEDIAVDNSQATVKIERDGFYVEGTAPVHVSVFSIDGKTCLSSIVAPHQTITLPTGLYIVKLGNKTMKIKI